MQMNLDLNEKRHDIVRPDVLFLSKTTRYNDRITQITIKATKAIETAGRVET